MKTLTEFNRDYEYKAMKKMFSSKPKGSPLKAAIFYAFLIIMVVLAFIYSGNEDAGKRFGPFSYNSVLSDSMDSVYPRGSLVASWELKPNEELKTGLDGGDDIVFVTKEGKVIVHRILEIKDDYEDSGQRGFVTQGVENPNPDASVTYEGNVVGKVIWNVPYIGGILGFIADHILYIGIGILGLFIIMGLLKAAFTSSPKKKIKQGSLQSA